MSRSIEDIAGLLSQRVTLQQLVRTADVIGGASLTWQDVATLWAHVEVKEGNESLDHNKLTARTSYLVIMRYRSDVTTSKRLLFNSRVLNIESVRDMYGNCQVLQLEAYEEV